MRCWHGIGFCAPHSSDMMFSSIPGNTIARNDDYLGGIAKRLKRFGAGVCPRIYMLAVVAVVSKIENRGDGVNREKY